MDDDDGLDSTSNASQTSVLDVAFALSNAIT